MWLYSVENIKAKCVDKFPLKEKVWSRSGAQIIGT